MVWLAWIQRGLIFWCEFEGGTGLLEFVSDGNVWRCVVGIVGFQAGEEVVDGWMVFRSYLGTCGCYARFWIHHTLGKRRFGRCDRSLVQLRDQE